MSYAGDENAPGFPSNDVQLVLEGVDAALQFVQRHAVRRDMQDALMIWLGTRECDGYAAWLSGRFRLNMQHEHSRGSHSGLLADHSHGNLAEL